MWVETLVLCIQWLCGIYIYMDAQDSFLHKLEKWLWLQ